MKEKAKVVVRKLRQEAAQPGWRRSKAIRWAIGIVLSLAIAALFPRAHSGALIGYSVGSLWTSEDVTAPFSYPIQKDDARLNQEIRKALEDLYPVYVPDTTARTETLKNFRRSWSTLGRIVELARKDTLDELPLLDTAKQLGLQKDDWSALASFSRTPRSDKAMADAEPILLKTLGDLEANRNIAATVDELGSAKMFSLRLHPREEVVLSRDSMLTTDAAEARLYTALEERLKRDPSVARAFARLAGNSLVPTVHFDPELTKESELAIEERVPKTDGIVVEGQKIVSKGEIITPPIKASLESLSRARGDRGGIYAQIGRLAGTIGHAAIIVLLIVLYLKFIRRRIYNDNAQLLLMALMLLFPAVLAFLSVRIQVAFPLEYFILIPVTSMLLTILFDSRTGFYGTVVAALIVAGIRGNDYSIALAGLCAGAFAAYTVRDLRSRSQLFMSITYIFLGYLVSIAALSLEQTTPIKDAGFQLLASLGNALISPVITLGVLYVVETIFDTVSDLRLTEYDNINHPLLRELALRAPGTYQHTMLVAQLAENASIAIGANPLLAKVGAYFHDVGKLAEPLDFVENQSSEAGNVHESLSPRESALRVRNHVEQGIELARAHSLPERLIDFIPMHHGTLPISFFYQRALAEAEDTATVNADDYRYQGPRPNTKETAIVMLADASEAVARSIVARQEEVTPEAIDQALDQLIRTRFEQGQLDQCDITVRDLTVIRTVFTRLLSGLHHARIQYPSARAASDTVTESREALAGA